MIVIIDIHCYSSVSLTDVIAEWDFPIGIFSQGGIAVIGSRFHTKVAFVNWGILFSVP